MYPSKNIITILFCIAVLLGCSMQMQGDEKDVTEEIKIQRFDKDLFNYLSNPSQSSANKLLKQYPTLFPAFGQISTGRMIENDTTEFFNAISVYFGHPALRSIYQDEMKKLEDLSSYEAILTQAKMIAKDLLPNKPFPTLAIHVSGFKENVIAIDGIISLSGDKYLGEAYPTYKNYFSEKERTQMNPYLMPRDYLRAWIISENLVKTSDKPSLLASIVEEGKVLFLLSKLLPDYTFEHVSGFNQKDLKWFDEHESSIWNSLSKGNALFQNDRLLISRYTDNIHTVQDFPNRTGSYIGWRIVELYAKNTNSTVQEVLSKDAATILKEAKYKP